MRRLPLLLVAVLGCSDYDLTEGRSDGKGTDPEDSTAPDIDSDTLLEDSADPPVDSGTVTVPDDTSPVQEVPEGKIDVVLLIDVAYVYSCYHAVVGDHASELVGALLSSGADVAVSIASFDDYNVDGEWYVAYGGLPYVLVQQLTTESSLLQSAASTLELKFGGDGPGSGYEAVVQATSGLGYDQDCDSAFDASYDVRPYDEGGSDAFGGRVSGTHSGATPGTGSTAGVGFRSGSKRVIVMFAENTIRDRGEGHDFPVGACLGTATRADAISGIRGVGAKFLGVNAYEFQDDDPALQTQLEDIADSTSSQIDSDGDGARDDIAVFSGSWDWPSTDTLVQGIWDLAQ